jgi:hypothetical protein
MSTFCNLHPPTRILLSFFNSKYATDHQSGSIPWHLAAKRDVPLEVRQDYASIDPSCWLRYQEVLQYAWLKNVSEIIKEEIVFIHVF